MTWGDWVRILGGLGLLLYGMELAGANLQLAAGRALRRVLAGLAESRWKAAGMGALTAFLVNSSGVTGVVVAGLAGAGVLAMGPALAVMAGGGLGSALTVQLIAFKAAGAGPLLVAAGVALGIAARGDRLRVWSRILLAAGLVFWGMSHLTAGMQAASRSPAMRTLLARSHGPAMGFFFGAAMTVATGSSSATVAFLMALAQAAGRSIEFTGPGLSVTVGAVLGANLGTCVTPWVASRHGSLGARQAATTYLFYKLLLAAALLPLAGRFADLILILTRQGASLVSGGPEILKPDAARVVANLHMAVNVLGVLVAVPFSDALVRLAARVLPAPREAEALRARYLDAEALKTPELALEQARREILRLAATVREMLAGVIGAFAANSPDFNRRLAAKDERVDRLQHAVTEFLSALMARAISRETSERAVALIGAADDLENVSDVVVRDLLRLSDKKARLGPDFSPAGWEELKAFHAGVLAVLDGTLEAFELEDPAGAESCLARGEALLAEEARLRRSHIARLSSGLPEALETSAIHLDVLHGLGGVVGHLNDLNRSLLGRA